MDQSRPPGIQIAQIFLERAHFSHRSDFLSLPPNTPMGNPEVGISVESGVAPDGKRGLVRVRAQTKTEQRPLYEVDVVMTALVQAQEGQENLPIEDYVRVAGPGMVFTFVRQMVAELTLHGRFGPLWISPVNLLAPSQRTPSMTKEQRVLSRVQWPTGEVKRVKGKVLKPKKDR